MAQRGRPTNLSKGNGMAFGHNHPADTSYGEPDLASEQYKHVDWAQTLHDTGVLSGIILPANKYDVWSIGKYAKEKTK